MFSLPFVCLFVSQQDYAKTTELISIALGTGVQHHPRRAHLILEWIWINRRIQEFVFPFFNMGRWGVSRGMHLQRAHLLMFLNTFTSAGSNIRYETVYVYKSVYIPFFSILTYLCCEYVLLAPCRLVRCLLNVSNKLFPGAQQLLSAEITMYLNCDPDSLRKKVF